MNDHNRETHGATNKMPPGVRLRQAREARNLSLEEVASHLRLSVDKIASLEQGEVEDIAAPVFVSGYLRAYAKLVGLSGDEVVADFDALAKMDSPSMDPASSPAGNDYGRVASASVMQKITEGGGRGGKMTLLASILVVLVIVFYLVVGDGGRNKIKTAKNDVEQIENDSKDNISNTDNVSFQGMSEQNANSNPVTSDTEQKDSTNNINKAQGTASVTESASKQSDSKQVKTDTEQKDSTNNIDKIQGTPSVTEGAAKLSELTLQFNKESWVEVTDATGQRLLFRLGKAGMSKTVTGVAPFRVQLGFVPGVSITYNGKSYDLSRYANRRIAILHIGNAGDSNAEN